MNPTKKKELQKLRAMAQAALNSMNTVIGSSQAGSSGFHFSSFRYYLSQYNRIAMGVFGQEPKARHDLVYYDEEKVPTIGDSLDITQHAIFQDVHSNLSMLCAWIDAELGEARTSSQARSLTDFLESSLRPAMLSKKPSTEKEVQDTVERILIGRGMQKGTDYVRETGRVKYSGKESIPDFIFQAMSLALEVKLVKEASRRNQVVDEINADVVSYGTEYNHLAFVVYDNGSIDNVSEFKGDIESSGNVTVVVVKH